jgi:hypothetical protein
MQGKWFAMAFLALTGAAAPQPRTYVCMASGWAKGIADVRAQPSPRARLLARLAPRPAVQNGEDVNGTLPEFEIRGARNGWFLIAGASYGDYGDPAPRRPLYAGQGWVHGDRIGGQVFPGGLHVAPSERARSRPYGKETDAVEVRRLLDCRGQWLQVETDVGTGWVHGLCGNQVTTCS